MTPLRQKLIAELLGTFMLVLATTGSAAAGVGLLGNALANGLMLSVLVAAFAGVSGAHFNPAVTLAFAVVGRCKWSQVAPYVAVQLLAAAAAAYTIAELYRPLIGVEGIPATLAPGAGLPAAESVPALTVLLGEMLITCLLMLGIYGTMIDPRGRCCYGGVGDSQAEAKIGGLGVGFVVAANILLLGPVTGGSMNPARSFGPALVRGEFGLHWCYWIGPLVGAIVGAVAYEQLLRVPPKNLTDVCDS